MFCSMILHTSETNISVNQTLNLTTLLYWHISIMKDSPFIICLYIYNRNVRNTSRISSLSASLREKGCFIKNNRISTIINICNFKAINYNSVKIIYATICLI